MTDTITLTGLIATEPRHVVAGEGNLPITSFRLASTQRRFDRTAQKWVDAETNWYTITTFRHLATHAAASLERGQRVVVTGRLKFGEWEKDGRVGTTVEVIADALGHDLFWGTSVFTRSASSTSGATGSATPAEGGSPSASGGGSAPPVDQLAEARARKPDELAVPF